MNELHATGVATTHQVYRALLRVTDRDRSTGATGVAETERDRGAVSLEQVLWYVAAGVAVAVIAGILWDQIRDQANTPVVPPVAPTP